MKRKVKNVKRGEELQLTFGMLIGSGDDDVENTIYSNSSIHSDSEAEVQNQIQVPGDDGQLLIEDEELPFYLELIKGINSSVRKKSRTQESERVKRKKRVIELVDEGDVIFDRLEHRTEIVEHEPETDPLLEKCGKEVDKVDDDEVLEETSKDVKPKCVNPEVYPDPGAKLPECPQCKLVFKTVADYRQHMTIVHDDLRHKCDVCFKHFGSGVILRQHRRNHGPKKFLCNICGSGFPFQAGLRRHVLVHTREKPFPCTFCPKTFTQENHLKKHLTSHSQVKPFECITCEMRFRYKDGLVRHCRLLNHVS